MDFNSIELEKINVKYEIPFSEMTTLINVVVAQISETGQYLPYFNNMIINSAIIEFYTDFDETQYIEKEQNDRVELSNVLFELYATSGLFDYVYSKINSNQYAIIVENVEEMVKYNLYGNSTGKKINELLDLIINVIKDYDDKFKSGLYDSVLEGVDKINKTDFNLDTLKEFAKELKNVD